MQNNSGKPFNHTRNVSGTWQLAQAAFLRGDYVGCRSLCTDIAQSSAPEGQKQQALQRLAHLKQDAVELYVGLGSLSLYLVAWVYALCQA